jgi:hypothetical protein
MEIRLLRSEELPKLQKFLHDNWKADHIFVTNKKLFDFQHWNGKDYNFVIAIDDGEILCVLGFIMPSQYDPDIARKDIWLAIWKRLDSPKSKGLGIKLLDYIEETYHPDTIGTVGMNANTEQLYLARGWKTGVMNHYYLPNIGRIAGYEKSGFSVFSLCIGNHEFNTIPQKSETYLRNRYELHPFYDYVFYNIQDCLLVIRKIQVKQDCCLRIVDIIGEFPENIQFNMQSLLNFHKADYIDCVNYGIPKEQFLKMGFYEKPDNLILPNWFEPYTLEHKPILFAYKAPSDNYVIFKGDADQDRPSII